MNQEPANSKSKHPRGRLAGAIGAMFGGVAGLGISKLIGFESFWLGLMLVVGGIGMGGFLAQKIASK